MALVSAGYSISGVNTATSVLLNLKAASTRSINVLEWNVFYAVLSSNAYQLALYRMNAVGTGAITSTAGATHVSGDTAQTVLETAWATTRPSVTGSAFRQFTIPLTLGAGVSWPLGNIIPPGGILVPVSGGLCLQGVNASGATTGTINGSVTWDE